MCNIEIFELLFDFMKVAVEDNKEAIFGVNFQLRKIYNVLDLYHSILCI